MDSAAVPPCCSMSWPRVARLVSGVRRDAPPWGGWVAEVVVPPCRSSDLQNAIVDPVSRKMSPFLLISDCMQYAWQPQAHVESLEPEDSGEHQSDDMDDDSPPHIFIGKDHQAEIPNLATDDERRQYMSNSLDSCMELGYDFPIFNKKEEELQLHHSSETRDEASSRDGESRMTLSCPASWRRQELISRLKSKIIEEAHDLLEMIFKSFSDGQISFVDFVFDLKSAVGTEAFVKAVGIGKDFSSLSLEDIIKFLTGGFRISKTRSNDLFWEAVWPRLLARGWHSEQPNDVSTTKNCLVFVVPDPTLLEIEADAMGNGVAVEKNGCDTDLKLNQDVSLDGHHEPPKFTIIDTSLVQGEEPSQVREIRNLPADANISFVPSHHSHKMVSVSSSYEQDTNDISSNCKEDCARLTADVNGIETVEAYNAGNEKQVVSLQNMVTASCSVFPVSGHSSNGNGDTVGLTRFFDQKTKGGKRKYLSPVSKHRRLTSCSNGQASRHNFSFSKVVGPEKKKIKPKAKPSEQVMDASNMKTDTVKPKAKPSERKVDELATVNSKITTGDTKPAKEATQLSDLANQPKPETQHDGKTTTIACIPSSDNHGSIKDNEAASGSNMEMIPDAWEATRSVPVSPHSQPALQASHEMNPRRQGTRVRPPTARALEAVAFGLLGDGKRKADHPRSTGTSRPRQRACKSTRETAPACLHHHQQ
ncbi:hypothetical protein GUJ93_ZPchr0013g34403 [Zizania palustris]|uniref:Uncharacterized protein n=1 Tax=Zizania palustris TaxID=103762 RepID=A0A8J5X0V3_ZIZPA|nr:hypothetical protein GUJ93_ZPchr0013g34403 [Zizania palustris]